MRVTTLDLTSLRLLDRAFPSLAPRPSLIPRSSGQVLEKVVDYFLYWYKNRDKDDVPDMDIPVELCLEILMAADYLGLDGKQ